MFHFMLKQRWNHLKLYTFYPDPHPRELAKTLDPPLPSSHLAPGPGQAQRWYPLPGQQMPVPQLLPPPALGQAFEAALHP